MDGKHFWRAWFEGRSAYADGRNHRRAQAHFWAVNEAEARQITLSYGLGQATRLELADDEVAAMQEP